MSRTDVAIQEFLTCAFFQTREPIDNDLQKCSGYCVRGDIQQVKDV